MRASNGCRLWLLLLLLLLLLCALMHAGRLTPRLCLRLRRAKRRSTVKKAPSGPGKDLVGKRVEILWEAEKCVPIPAEELLDAPQCLTSRRALHVAQKLVWRND